MTSIRGALAADPDLGAGNVLTTRMAYGIGLDEPALAFDTDVDGHPAGQPLTLREVDRCVAARAAWLHERGIGPRDPVAVYGTGAADQMLTFLALTRLGAIPALVNGNLAGGVAAAYLPTLHGVGVLAAATRLAVLAQHDTGTAVLGDVTEPANGAPDRAPAAYRHHPDDPIA